MQVVYHTTPAGDTIMHICIHKARDMGALKHPHNFETLVNTGKPIVVMVTPSQTAPHLPTSHVNSPFPPTHPPHISTALICVHVDKNLLIHKS